MRRLKCRRERPARAAAFVVLRSWCSVRAAAAFVALPHERDARAYIVVEASGILRKRRFFGGSSGFLDPVLVPHEFKFLLLQVRLSEMRIDHLRQLGHECAQALIASIQASPYRAAGGYGFLVRISGVSQ
jgi:hypothetical protein